MQFIIDNNLPPSLARGLNELSVHVGIPVHALKDKFDPATPDIQWIEYLSKEKDWVVVSQDRFRKGSGEKEAIRRSGLIVFYLDKQWAKQPYWSKAHRIVQWWPEIIKQAQMVSGGAAFSVPWRITSKKRFQQAT